MIILFRFLEYLLQILSFAILARVIVSWISPGFDNPIVRVLYEVTEPVLSPLRQFIPRLGMFDLTPVIALLLIQLLEQLVAQMAYSASF